MGAMDVIGPLVRAETRRRVAENEWQAEIAIQNGCGLVCASDRSEVWASREVPFGRVLIFDPLVHSSVDMRVRYPEL